MAQVRRAKPWKRSVTGHRPIFRTVLNGISHTLPPPAAPKGRRRRPPGDCSSGAAGNAPERGKYGSSGVIGQLQVLFTTENIGLGKLTHIPWVPVVFAVVLSREMSLTNQLLSFLFVEEYLIPWYFIGTGNFLHPFRL